MKDRRETRHSAIRIEPFPQSYWEMIDWNPARWGGQIALMIILDWHLTLRPALSLISDILSSLVIIARMTSPLLPRLYCLVSQCWIAKSNVVTACFSTAYFSQRKQLLLFAFARHTRFDWYSLPCMTDQFLVGFICSTPLYNECKLQ